MQETIDFVLNGHLEFDAYFVMAFFCFCIMVKAIIMICSTIGNSRTFR